MFSIKFLFVFLAVSICSFAQESAFNNFITSSGGKLFDGDKEFRFISFNIPNLNYVEDEFGFDNKHPYRMPDTYELTDAMESIKQLGGDVIRIYTIPVRNINEEEYPTYVLAPGQFDEQSFKTMDTMLYLANKIGVRIIIPFVNNWQWMGGRPQYADFRGKTQDEFWTDPQLINDVKETIKYVINRKNTLTGIAYKDDKSILCWETGNELGSPYSWISEIVRYIKSIDKNHLVMDGYCAPFHEEALTDPNIDILTSHHYEENPAEIIANITKHMSVINNRKAYIIGEFGFISTPAIEYVLDFIKDNPISGALIWSLRHHRREGGFYWHSEPLGMGIYKAYHWPGFANGIEYDEMKLLEIMQQKAFEIQGKNTPALVPPKAPVLLNISEASNISWQGSVGVSSYNIERSEVIEGPWEIIGLDVNDADIQYFSLFNDENAEPGKEYYYRVIAKNAAGLSSPSNIVGPVKIFRKCLIDNMKNFGVLFYKKGNIRLMNDNDRVFREIMYRLEGDTSSEIIYLVAGKIDEVNLYAFSEADEPSIELSVSGDNTSYEQIKFTRKSLFAGKGDYGYWVPCVYSSKLDAGTGKYLKIKFINKTQLGRAEIYYK